MYGGSNYTNNRKERENYGLSHQCWIDVRINHQRPISLIIDINKKYTKQQHVNTLILSKQFKIYLK